MTVRWMDNERPAWADEEIGVGIPRAVHCFHEEAQPGLTRRYVKRWAFPPVDTRKKANDIMRARRKEATP